MDIIKEQNKGVLDKYNLYQEVDIGPGQEEARRMKTQKDFYNAAQREKFRDVPKERPDFFKPSEEQLDH